MALTRLEACPPSTDKVAPFIYEASSDARKRNRIGRLSRPADPPHWDQLLGITADFVAQHRRHRRRLHGPGNHNVATDVARPTFGGDGARKIDDGRLGCAVTGHVDVPNRPQIEETFTIDPPLPCSCISFIAVRVPQNVPSTVVEKFECQSAVEVFSIGPSNRPSRC